MIATAAPHNIRRKYRDQRRKSYTVRLVAAGRAEA